MAAKIRRGDEVIVLTGKDKGKHGRVKNILPTGRAIVEGINLIKKHQKPLPAINRPGGFVEREATIDISNLAILNIATNKAERIGFKVENGKKMRILKSNGEIFK